ncbi:MAG: S46 family peptidase [Candidatus Aminicenantes bacterium]|nr:MAG: S46 family peptidase [Candidatus Aminicenantes bacterium]
MKFRRNLMAFVLILGMAFFVFADEGMWLPHQMKDLNLRKLGLQMNPEDLYKKDGTGLMSAVVYLGGGTGEFVSPDGLILTNHHVAFGALQRAATKEKDYIKDGFIAWTKKEEIPAKGYIADVLLGYEDVTDEILSTIKPDMTYRERYEAIDKARKKLISEAENAGKDLRATVTNMYSGNNYYLFRFKRIKDIRISYAPPRDLGNFGGDIDNWMWPRHTCDFTFLRAYVSKDNVGVDHSLENVPYKPKSIIKISTEGFKEGDFSFVMGYPGRTYRNYTLSELQFDIENLKKRMEEFKDIIAFFETAGKDKRDIQIKYASILNGLNNGLKNYQGKIEGMRKISLVEKKKVMEKDFLGWVDQDSERKKKYGDILKKIETFMKRYARYSLKNSSLSQIVSSYMGSTLLSQGYLVYRTAEERQKPDMEREPSYQERNFPLIKMRIQLAERGYDLKTDRAFLKHQMKKLFDLPEDQLPSAIKDLISKRSEKAVDDFVDSLYDQTSLAEPKKRLKLIGMEPDELLKLGDPILNLASELEKEMKALRDESKVLGQERLELKKVYENALIKQKKGRIAPDANSTIRFTYGFIKGYYPRDAVYYRPQTTLGGVIEKDTGKFPFNVPGKLKNLYKIKDFGPYIDKKLNDIPACFLNTTSVTGGNSGSPTLNAKGEQIGIIFDMTYESVTADYYIVPELQRTISVDIRYVLFITEKFSGAKHIIKELGF